MAQGTARAEGKRGSLQPERQASEQDTEDGVASHSPEVQHQARPVQVVPKTEGCPVSSTVGSSGEIRTPPRTSQLPAVQPKGPSHTGADLTARGKAKAQCCVENKLLLLIIVSRNINANDLIICIVRTIKLMLQLKENIPPLSSLEMSQGTELISCKLAASLHSVLSPPGTLLFLTPLSERCQSLTNTFIEAPNSSVHPHWGLQESALKALCKALVLTTKKATRK